MKTWLLSVACLGWVPPAWSATHCVNFDDLASGSTFVGPFASGGVNIDVLPVFGAPSHPCGGGTFFNMAIADVFLQVPGRTPPNEMMPNNVNLRFHMADFFGGAPVKKLIFRYADNGGVVNISVNGDCYSVNDFTDIPSGTLIGGVKYKRTLSKVVLKAKTRDIDGFAVGGQQFFIDNVCAKN